MKTISIKKVKNKFDDKFYELKLKHNEYQSTVLGLTLEEVKQLEVSISKILKKNQ